MLHANNEIAPQFIVIEGIDGAGKSTHIETIIDFFKAKKETIIQTREPGGTALGEKIRELVLNDAMSIETETLLMFAARKEHLNQVILPALKQGYHVLSDRFTDATYAYQGAGRGVSTHQINILENWVQGSFRPNFTLIFDIDPDIARQRLETISNGDRFELQDTAFFERVREAYTDRARLLPDQYAIIDGNQDIHSVKNQLLSILQRQFG